MPARFRYFPWRLISGHIDVVDPDQPVFLLHIDGSLAAGLFEPVFSDMFWCSYRVDPTSEDQARRLLKRRTWDGGTTRLEVTTPDCEPQRTFPGGADAYRYGETNRMCFRSLWPPKSRVVPPSRRRRKQAERLVEWLVRKRLRDRGRT